MNNGAIIPKMFDKNCCTYVRGTVSACYDTNADGHLLPVVFLQREGEVQLANRPFGKTYIQYED